jgi:hypothetical protein
MTQHEQINLAVQAVRGQLRYYGVDPYSTDSQGALRVLDDMARVHPDLLACQWYAKATEHQVRRFRQVWDTDRN